MIKEIKYNGYSANPSDYECADGDLATTMGLIQEDGTMKPVLPPSLVLQLGEGESVKFIHKTTSYTHYIVVNRSTAYAYDKKNNRKISIESMPYDIQHFDAVGNTLLVFSDSGIYYYLWKNDKYQSLGNHIPDLEISFGLVGRPRLFSLSDDSKSTFTISFDGISEGALLNELSESNKNKITDQIMAKVNKFVAQETVNKGRFCFPFFVRYALRLYDGSLVYHSAPVLMNPSTKAAPIVFWKRATGKGSYSSAECDIMLVAATLDYRSIKNYAYTELEDWTDIIKSVDVFISKPIYTYDQNGKISSFADTDNYTTKFIGRLYADNPSTTTTSRAEDKLLGSFTSKDFLNYYCEWRYSHIYSMYYASDRKYPSTTFNLPEFSEGKVAESLHNTSTFYKLCSIDVSDVFNDDRKEIIVEDEYLQSLVTREVMTDDYLSRDQLYAETSFVYNNRLNLSGLRRKPFCGYLAQSMFAWCNKHFDWKVNTDNSITIGIAPLLQDSYSVKVFIKENGRDYEVSSATIYRDMGYMRVFNSIDWTVTGNDGVDRTEKNKCSWGCYLFYPNTNAYKMVIYNYGEACYVVDLKPHEFLNGAYAILDYELVREKNFTTLPNIGYYPIQSQVESNFPIEITNKIYTSEVNNPFYFPVLGINTVGTGDILGICAAAKALSEGQFGQFPLYAFTTEGVWALEVSNTGTYSAKQPFTRDVVINPDSITQIDSAVLFATDRGIMHISGSTVQCISDRLNTEEMFSIADLPKCDKLINIFNGKANESEQITLDDISLLPFNEFLQGCRMVYDYTNQHLIVYNPAVRYAYVYSLKSQTWGMMRSDIVDNVNSYPEALAMADGAKLVDFSKPVAENITALIITRPFKIDDPNTFKTINTIIQRGMFRSTHVQQVLYGSNDLIHWHTVWSSVDKIMRGFRGTPYKAFRLALVCKFDKGESIYGCTVVYEPRMANQVR